MPNQIPKWINTAHYAEKIGNTPDVEAYNKVIRAKNAVSDAEAFQNSVYNEALGLYGSPSAVTALGRPPAMQPPAPPADLKK